MPHVRRWIDANQYDRRLRPLGCLHCGRQSALATAKLRGNRAEQVCLPVVAQSARVQGSAQALQHALSCEAGVRRMKASALVHGTLERQQIELTTDLDRILKDAVAGLARREAAKLESALQQEIFAETSAPVKQTGQQLDGFGRIGDELKGRLNLGDNLLKGLL